jgi:hypothetical protein
MALPPIRHAAQPKNRPAAAAGSGEARPDIAAINLVAQKLALLQRRIREVGLDRLAPVWEHIPHDNSGPAAMVVGGVMDQDEKEEARRTILQDIDTVVEHVQKLIDKDTIRPDGRHRLEFSILAERILKLYRYCCSPTYLASIENNDSSSADIGSGSVLGRAMHVEKLLTKTYRLELSHRQCSALVRIAAYEGKWDAAADIYLNHIDPDQAGYTPVVLTTSTNRRGGTETGGSHDDDMDFTVSGLYCVARAALESHAAPVEHVFRAVSNLSSVSPSDTEKCASVLSVIALSLLEFSTKGAEGMYCFLSFSFCLLNFSFSPFLLFSQTSFRLESLLDTPESGRR